MESGDDDDERLEKDEPEHVCIAKKLACWKKADGVVVVVVGCNVFNFFFVAMMKPFPADRQIISGKMNKICNNATLIKIDDKCWIVFRNTSIWKLSSFDSLKKKYAFKLIHEKNV